MSANTINQIIELLEDGYTSCTISKYAMREIKALQEKSELTTACTTDTATPCPTCAGKGYVERSEFALAPNACDRCDGTGKLPVTIKNHTLYKSCIHCNGTGKA